jgi:hypothetical protein
MKITEISSPQDQLALWKLISDKVWLTFDQQIPKHDVSTMNAGATQAPRTQVNTDPKNTPIARPVSKAVSNKSNTVKKVKPKMAPMAPAPKPPQPKPLDTTASQNARVQAQNNQQLVKQIQQVLNKKQPVSNHYIPPVQRTDALQKESPSALNYGDKDKEELVFHRRQNPLKPIDLRKP